jgi:hypothetical protein
VTLEINRNGSRGGGRGDDLEINRNSTRVPPFVSVSFVSVKSGGGEPIRILIAGKHHFFLRVINSGGYTNKIAHK